MKFALKIRKIYKISLMLYIAVLCNLNAQQFSYIQNNHTFSLNRYTFPNRLGVEKSYSISQNKLGTLFLSTNKGIIVFDGQDWEELNFRDSSFLANSSNILYVFSKNFTGEINRDDDGFYSITEIKINYPGENWVPLQVSSSQGTICLIANGKVWKFYENHFEPLLDVKENASLISTGNNIFLKQGADISILKKGSFVAADTKVYNNINSKYFNGSKELSVYLSEKKSLMLTGSIPNDNFEFPVPIKDDIQTTYADWNGNLWILSGSALYCLQYIDYFKHISNLPSYIISPKGIAKDSSGLILADQKSIYTIPAKLLQTSKNNIQYINCLDNKIIVCEKDRIYQWNNKGTKALVSRPINYITQCKDKLLFVSKGFLYSLRIINNSLSVKELIHLKTDSIQKLVVRQDGDIFLLDKHGEIYWLMSNPKGFSCETIYKPGGNYSTPAIDNIFLLNDEVYASNALNIYKLKGNKLVSQVDLKLKLPSSGHFIDYLESDATGNIIFSSKFPGKNKQLFFGKCLGNEKYNWFEIPLWNAGLKNPAILDNNGKEIILFENGNLFQLNLDKFFKCSKKIALTTGQILVNERNLLLQHRKSGKEMVPYFEALYPANLISIKFKAIDLIDPGTIQYSFLLENKEPEWSPWTNTPDRNFSNLSSGEYKLLVRAQTMNGSVSDIFTIRFKVWPPFYRQWYAWTLYIITFLGLVGLWGFRRKRMYEKERLKLERIIQERTSELTREKEKTDELLANMLPKDTADELKNTGKASSHKFDMVTVLFSDIQGFTKIAEQMNPEKLIDELDNIFFQFDSVVGKYNIEKIKTIGDAYMAAGGIPYKNRTNPVEVVLAALEMQEYMKILKSKNSDIWDLRIGVHTGAVIAGVVGHKRLSYDIWGDTVNTASRMESSGEASKINISGQTYELVKEFFICEYRGKMPVKYKGDIDMYFVKGIRPELSINLRSIPNRNFFIQLQLLRLIDLEEFVFTKLETELSHNLKFHNLKHTRDVCTQAELLGRAENITGEEMLLLRTAALFHDTGYIFNYNGHEVKSTEICREILPKFNYADDQINIICDLILSTKRNTRPANKIAEILYDANYDYLGRVDFLSLTLNLLSEQKSYNDVKNDDEWLQAQIRLLETHTFYTETARKLQEVYSDEQIRKIRVYLKQNV